MHASHAQERTPVYDHRKMIFVLGLFIAGALATHSQTPLVASGADISALMVDPVCIVGAGPGGLTVAHELEAKGVPTVVFEKQETVGGKCQSFYDGPNQDVYHPMGALIFTNKTWVHTLPLIRAAGLPLSPGPTPSHRMLYGAGPAASNVVPSPPMTDSQRAVISAELANYAAYWMSEFAPKYTALRYINGVPEELTVPLAQWLRTKGFLALPRIMQAAMVPYGYGDITQTPALYGLQYFNPDVLGVFLGVAQSYSVDFHKVMVDYAASVQGPIHLGATVTTIDRSHSAPIISYTHDNTEHIQKCSKVVLAFPPTLENLDAVGLSLSPEEHTVFSKVEVTSYWASAVSTKIPFPQSFVQTPFQPINAPVAFLRVFEESPIATAWSWGPSHSNASIEEATEILMQTMSDVQTGLAIESSMVQKDDVKRITRWDYFPHFDEAALKEGVYERYNALQGKDNTFFTSGLDGFELVEFAIRAGKDLVGRYF
ncbi:FAD/NAD-P-binding domain-containing protein [Irpex rosettiformis]|uniref:FAD/NAD-P-binding domain-containing protein n=1 Tax=Irpex rosettiformis TaxID=378272 RepID=A0ACB8TZU5_9APHY|nr:FAD/NAD-P-binding domain-containing protein [Irpex rosettiformis]